MDGYWKRLLVQLGISSAPKPVEYEIYNGTVVFWFDDPVAIKPLLKRLKESGLPYSVQWDADEGLTGLSLKRELIN